MKKNIVAMLGLAMGLALTGLSAAPASALTVSKAAVSDNGNVVEIRHGRSHFGRGHFGRRHFGGRHFGHRGFGHRHFFRPRFYAAPIYSYGYAGGSCQWLKRKAIRTGSGYWWSRYNDCRYGY